MNLEFEKSFYELLLINKKRYAGLLWTPDGLRKKGKFDKMKCMGIEAARRSGSDLQRNIQLEFLKELMGFRQPDRLLEYLNNSKSENALEILRELFQDGLQKVKSLIAQKTKDLFAQEIDISKLVETRGFDKMISEYKGKLPPHIQMMERARRKDPTKNWNLGDRVPYVWIQRVKGQKSESRAEDPARVLFEDIPIDVNLYFENHIKAPLERLLRIILRIDPKTMKMNSEQYGIDQCVKFFDDIRLKTRRVENVSKDSLISNMESMFSNQAGESVLRQRCLVCDPQLQWSVHSPYSRTSTAAFYLCDQCQRKPESRELLRNTLESLKSTREEYTDKVLQNLERCRACQGDNFGQFECITIECDLYYERFSNRICRKTAAEKEQKIRHLIIEYDEQEERRTSNDNSRLTPSVNAGKRQAKVFVREKPLEARKRKKK